MEVKKLEPAVKALWTGALRSGYFAQGRSYLSKPASNGQGKEYCCLGVLCQVLGLPTDDDSGMIHGPIYQPVSDLIGLKMVALLADMNDKANLTFNEIADYIEKNL